MVGQLQEPCLYEQRRELHCKGRYISLCKHGRQEFCCRDCRGKGICVHDRRRNTCIECGGASVCMHKRRRSQCKLCAGSQICVHGRERPTCKLCNPSRVCEHNNFLKKCNRCCKIGYLELECHGEENKRVGIAVEALLAMCWM